MLRKLLLLATLLCAPGIHAQTYDVQLQDKDGQGYTIGTLEKHGTQFGFERTESVFKDFFLSMKEMKCLEGPEIWCHIPYPYEKEAVTADNALTWLSHDLLFMYKKADQFGAQLSQGVYFVLTPSPEGFSGTPHHVDLNLLASTPEDLSTPPIGEFDIEPMEPEARWLPVLKLIRR